MTDQPATTSTYEFTGIQNDVIGRLSIYMRIIAGIVIAWAVISIFLADGLGSYLVSALLFMIGTCTWRAGVAFKKIVKSNGSDISHLMEALTNIRNVYLAQVVVTGILFAGMLFVFGIVIFA